MLELYYEQYYFYMVTGRGVPSDSLYTSNSVKGFIGASTDKVVGYMDKLELDGGKGNFYPRITHKKTRFTVGFGDTYTDASGSTVCSRPTSTISEYLN